MYELKISIPSVVKEEGDVCQTPEQIYELMKDTANLSQETFNVITLNAKNRLIQRRLVTLGLADCSLVHPREVFHYPVVDMASGVILVHNHPSGDPSPSSNDLRITKMLLDASKIMNIPILDHIIIGRPEAVPKGADPWLSMREEGLLNFG